jgi:hypothetical protein
MSTEYRDQSQPAGTSRINMRSTSRTSNLPHEAPIEPGHSLSTGLQLVHDQSKEDGHSDMDDEYGHQFVMKRLKRNLPLPGRWTLFIMLYVLLWNLSKRTIRKQLISGCRCSWSCSSLDGMMPVRDPYYHHCKSIIMSITQSVCDPTMLYSKRLMPSINNLGCKFRRIRSGRYLQCLVNG